MMSSAQLRAARALVRWDQSKVAQAADVSIETVKRLEKMEGPLGSVRVNTIEAIQRALEGAGVLFIVEDTHGPGVRLLRTTAFEEALSSLIYTHGTDADLSRVEAIAKGFSAEDRGALSLAFGDRVWRVANLPSDARGAEIQDRLIFPERFRS